MGLVADYGSDSDSEGDHYPDAGGKVRLNSQVQSLVPSRHRPSHLTHEEINK
jgi:hypothetical protein